MKKIFYLISTVLILGACTPKGEYKVTGTVEDAALEGKSIYLGRFNTEEDAVKADTAVIKDGKFEFKGIQETPVVYYVSVDDPEAGEIGRGIPLLVKPGKLWVKISSDKKIEVGGNPETDAYQKSMVELQRPLLEKMQAIDKQYREAMEKQTMTPEIQSGLENEVEQIYEQVRTISADYVLQNISNPLGEEIFMTHIQLFDTKQKDEMLAKASESFKSTPAMREIITAIEAERKVAVGQKFTDFILPNKQGKEEALSSYAGKGKYVLLDFWASWCGPCMKEMPTLLEAYQLYKGKNFEIVGVSLDQDKDAWLNTVQKMNITWPQLSDLQGCREATRPYVVMGIPHTVLIDPQGTIIEKDLRGAALLEKLQEVVK